METNKITYREFISHNRYNTQGNCYYEFRSWKVYWAYKWWVAEQIDKKGFIKGTVNPLNATKEDIVYSRYVDKYKK